MNFNEQNIERRKQFKCVDNQKLSLKPNANLRLKESKRKFVLNKKQKKKN